MKNWSVDYLSNLCQIVKGDQLNRLNLEEIGEYPCINGGITESGFTNVYNRLENTITISEGGNSCGYINFVKTKFWSGGHCYSLLSLNKSIVKEFLYYALKSREKNIMKLRVGSGLPNIQCKALKEFLIPFPIDKYTQSKIATILSTVDKSIEQTEALIAKYTRIKTGLMQDLLTKGIDENGNIRNKKTHKFVIKNGIEVPEEWEVLTVKDFANITTGSSDTQDKVVYGMYPFFVRSQIVEKSNRYIFDGEGVLTSGDGVGVGKIFHYIKGKFDFHQRVYLIYDFANDKVLGKYFFNYFKENFYNEVSRYSAKTTVDSVRLNMISDMLIPLPQFAEQLEIVKLLESAEIYLKNSSLFLHKLHLIKNGLMQDLLSGKKECVINQQ